MSVLIHTSSLAVADATSPLAFERVGPESNPGFDRYLTLEGRRAFHVGNICDTCEFLFERLEGANDKVSPAKLGERLRSGVELLDGELLGRAERALPPGRYHAMLLELNPSLVQPGDPADYFTGEQVELWGVDTFWNLPHDPRTEYYRSDSVPLGDGGQLFEFVIPMMPSNWLDTGTLAGYTERLRAGDRPTALSISMLDVKQPADWEGDPATTEHWCLAHYLLDGHHKTLAAARLRLPVRLLSFLATEESIATEADIERTLSALAAVGPP